MITIDEIERWGDDIESAVNLALVELKATREEVEVEVLEQPTKGFFGIGSKLAHVKVTRKQKAVEEKAPEKKEEPRKVITKDTIRKDAPAYDPSEDEAKGEERSRRRRRRNDRGRKNRDDRERGDRSEAAAKSPAKEPGEKRERRPKPQKKPLSELSDGLEMSFDLPDITEPDDIDVFDFRKTMGDLPVVTEHAALTFLKDVTEKMGVKVDFVCRADDKNVLVDISGEDTRTIIGKRGQTLDAIQYLTSLVVNRDKKDYVRVVIDAENYRSRRQKTLEQLADRLGKKVARSGKSVRLEPMNPYERKVIHSTLQGNHAVTTRSEGQDPYRRVIIERI